MNPQKLHFPYKAILFLCVGIFPMLYTLPVHSAVWNAYNSWNLDWEKRYSQWIAHDLEPDFLKIVQIKVDCADLCYVTRAVFSRIHSLPFMASDYKGSKLGHYSSNFDRLPTASSWTQDQRFIAFLRKLIDHAGTASLTHDTYPVELTKETVQPGLVIYENMIASHACFIGQIKPENIIPVIFYESTVPARDEFLKTSSIDIFIYTNQHEHEYSGIVRWRWPQKVGSGWQYKNSKEMPYYSLYIYSEEFPYKSKLRVPLNKIAKESAANRKLTKVDYIQELVQLFKEQVYFRIEVVQQAQNILGTQPARASANDFQHLYSTHSRDTRLYDFMGQIWSAIHEYNLPRDRFFAELDRIHVTLSPRLPQVSLYYIFITANQRWLSPDPKASVEKRWGVYWEPQSRQWLFNEEYLVNEVNTWYRDPESQISRADP